MHPAFSAASVLASLPQTWSFSSRGLEVPLGVFLSKYAQNNLDLVVDPRPRPLYFCSDSNLYVGTSLP